jgi:hypothetical protein
LHGDGDIETDSPADLRLDLDEAVFTSEGGLRNNRGAHTVIQKK